MFTFICPLTPRVAFLTFTTKQNWSDQILCSPSLASNELQISKRPSDRFVDHMGEFLTTINGTGQQAWHTQYIGAGVPCVCGTKMYQGSLHDVWFWCLQHLAANRPMGITGRTRHPLMSWQRLPDFRRQKNHGQFTSIDNTSDYFRLLSADCPRWIQTIYVPTCPNWWICVQDLTILRSCEQSCTSTKSLRYPLESFMLGPGAWGESERSESNWQMRCNPVGSPQRSGKTGVWTLQCDLFWLHCGSTNSL